MQITPNKPQAHRPRNNSTTLLALAVVSLTLLYALTARAAHSVGSYTRLYEGIEYATGSTTSPRLERVWAIRISLRNPSVSLVATKGNGSAPNEVTRQGTDAFLNAHNVEVAVNASFGDPNLFPDTVCYGCLISDGVVYSQPQASPFNSQLQFTAAKIASLVKSTSVPSGMDIVVPGAEVILTAGDITTGIDTVNPHTAYGLSQNGKYLIMVCIDGRQPGWSEGCDYPETAQWLIDFGAYDGVMMDGGGSTCMVRKDIGVVNRPSDGSVRAVTVNLGVNSQGGSGQGPASISFRNTNRLDVFTRGSLNTVHQKTWTINGWSNWVDLAASTDHTPAVTEWSVGRIDLFYKNISNSKIYQMTSVADVWGTPVNLGSTSDYTPAVCSSDTNRMDLFFIDSNHQLNWKVYSAGAWQASVNLGSSTTSYTPAVCSPSVGRIDLFFVNDANNQIYQKTYSAGAWTSSVSLGSSTTTFGLAATSSASGQIDLVFINSSGDVMYKKYSAGAWASSINLNGNTVGTPSINTRGPNKLDIFYRGSNDYLYVKSFNNGAWDSNWANVDTFFE